MWNCLHRIHIEILRKIDFDLTVKSQHFVYIDVDIMPINFCLRKICGFNVDTTNLFSSQHLIYADISVLIIFVKEKK